MTKATTKEFIRCKRCNRTVEKKGTREYCIKCRNIVDKENQREYLRQKRSGLYVEH